MLKPNDYVRDTSQRTGYPTIYRILKIEGDRALVGRVGELISGRMAYATRRDESYRALDNLRVER